MPTKSTAKGRKRAPKLQLHKGTGQGRVRIDGRDIYLGDYESPECLQRYAELIAEWAASGYSLPVEVEEITVVEVCVRYLEHARTFYVKDGKPTSSFGHVERVARRLREYYGHLPAVEFTPRKLKALRQTWIDDGSTRSTCNTFTGMVKRIFRWAGSEDMIPPEVYLGLSQVEGLRKGRSGAKESTPIEPIAIEIVETAIRKMPRPVGGMVRFQLLTGCRPGEAVQLRMCDIDRSDPECWLYRPASHKTQHHGKSRTIAIGPRGIELVSAHFEGKTPWEYVFSPRDAIRERSQKAKGHRRAGQPPTRRKTERIVRDAYDTMSYSRAIQRACDAAGVERFAPNRLRHTFACIARDQFGLDGVQAALGHSHANTSEIYAQVNTSRAKEIAAKIG